MGSALRQLADLSAQDVPPWTQSAGNAPVMPSRHRYMSRVMSSGMNPEYQQLPEVSVYKTELIEPTDHVPYTGWRRRRDKQGEYGEAFLQFPNQQIIRKGGSTMAAKKA